jgi:hypothetical protein
MHVATGPWVGENVNPVTFAIDDAGHKKLHVVQPPGRDFIDVETAVYVL